MRAVSIESAVKRINRKLAHEGQQLRKTRPGSRARAELGEYYLMDLPTNRLECDDVPLGDLAYQLRILAGNERIGE